MPKYYVTQLLHCGNIIIIIIMNLLFYKYCCIWDDSNKNSASLHLYAYDIPIDNYTSENTNFINRENATNVKAKRKLSSIIVSTRNQLEKSIFERKNQSAIFKLSKQ